MTPRKFRISSARFAARSGWVETDVSIRFVSARAAGLRHQRARPRRASAHAMTRNCSRSKADRDARAYVIYRDSLVVKQEAERPARAALGIDEALKFGANPGTIFLGLRDGAPVFGMGIAPAAAEKLLRPRRCRRHRTARHGDAGRGAARPALGDRDGEIDGGLASAPRLLRQLRHAHRDEGRRLEARMSELQGRAFSAHRSGRDHAGDARATNACSAGRSNSRPACIRASRASSKPRRPSRTRSGARSSRNPASAAPT